MSCISAHENILTIKTGTEKNGWHLGFTSASCDMFKETKMNRNNVAGTKSKNIKSKSFEIKLLDLQKIYG